MLSVTHRRLVLALAAFHVLRTPGKISQLLRKDGIEGLEELFNALSQADQDSLIEESERLESKDLKVTLYGDPDFPASIVKNGRPVAPIIFYWGNTSLFYEPSIGMCGSRSATPLGLRAAQACGEEVSLRNMVVVSGYAKGVDTATHLAALNVGGKTIIVLAEGFNHFRTKREFAGKLDPRRVLVISQFPPTQPWSAYAAMARNSLIFGLSRALVVVEAGEKGGTLAAGQGALRMGRPVFVLNFDAATPVGNQMLLAAGGHPIHSREELGRAISSPASVPSLNQGELPF